jgi:hypothetical protein
MKYLSFCVFVLATHFGHAEQIQKVSSFHEVNLENVTVKSLILFDVDEVLVTPADVLLKPAGGNFSGWKEIKREHIDHCLSIMLAGTRYILVDSEAPAMIEKLFNKKVPSMAFTSCRTGSLGVIPSMEKWRIDQLNAVGIDFSRFFSEEHVFSELVDAKLNPPLFQNGILFCGDFYSSQKSTKGELLGIFLDRMNLRPELVVFIDDEMKNLEAVRQELEKRGIPFQGYLLEKPTPALDETVAQLQIQTVLEKKTWISDQDAAQKAN